MSVYKRGKIWWIHVEKDGQIFRQSAGTSDWQEAKRKEKELIGNIEAGKASPGGAPFARLEFDAALLQYRCDRMVDLSQSTQRSELDHSQPLLEFFGKERLNKITTEMIREGHTTPRVGPTLPVVGVAVSPNYRFSSTMITSKG